MSLKAENNSGNSLNTLTDVVRLLGETRGEMHQRFDQQDKRFDQQDKRFDQQDKKLSQLKNEIRENQQENRERFDKIEETLAIIVNHLKK